MSSDPSSNVRWLVPVTATSHPAVDPAAPLVSVVLPVFNEEAVIERSLATICDELTTITHRFRWEVIVIDDGSTDGTLAAVEAFAATRPGVRVVAHGQNLRLGQALRTAFAESAGDYVVTMDADLSYSADHITALLDRIVVSGADIAIASPYAPGGETHGIPWRREAVSRAANRFLGLTAQDHLRTVTGLVRAYRGPFIRALDLKAVDVDVNTEIIYKAQVLRARIEEMPAVLDWSGLSDRRAVSGSAGRARWATAKQLVSGFLFRPFLFFGIPGILALVAAAIVAVAGSAVAGGFLAVVGVVLLVAAVLSLQAKRYFEELFHLGSTLQRRLDR